MGKQVEILKHEPGLLAQSTDRRLLLAQRSTGIDLYVAHLNLPGIGRFQQVQAAQKGGFARATGTDDGNHFTGLHLQVDAVENRVAVEAFGQTLYRDHRQRSTSCWLTRASMRLWKCARMLHKIQYTTATARYMVNTSNVRAVISCAWRNSSGT